MSKRNLVRKFMKEIEEINQFIRNSDYAEAIDKLKNFLVTNLDVNIEIHRAWAYLYSKQGKYSSAVEKYSLIIESGSAGERLFYGSLLGII